MPKFIARETRDIEKNYSNVEVKDSQLGLDFSIPISQDTLDVVLKLRSDLEDLQKQSYGLEDLNSIENFKQEIKKKNISQKEVESKMKNLKNEAMGEALENAFDTLLSGNTLEEAKEELEAKAFFSLEGVDEEEILNAYCEARGIENTKTNKNIGLMAFKVNKATIDNKTLEDVTEETLEENKESVNFFQFWFKHIIFNIEKQFGLNLNKNKDETF